jgi:hypothetical protein
VNQRIVALLEERTGEAFAAQDIAAALDRTDKLRSIAAALSGLAGRGLVKRSGAGRYASLKTVITSGGAESVYPVASNTLVSDPQLLLDALVRGESTDGTARVPDSTTYARTESARSEGSADAETASPARAEKPKRRPRASKLLSDSRDSSDSTGGAKPEAADEAAVATAPAVQPRADTPRPPRLQGDEKTTQTASGAYVIRRRRASAA